MRAYLLPLIVLFAFGCKQAAQKVMDSYPNGQASLVFFYPDNSDTSTYSVKGYYESGKLKHESKVESNLFIGEKKTFYENGKIERIEKLSKPTSLNATEYDCHVVNFRVDGTKESEYQYLKNKLSGLSIDYDSLGKKAKSVEYINGRISGKEIDYFPSGQVKSIAFVTNDTLRGFDIEFKENGDTLKWYHNGEFGVNGMFRKKWMNNGLVLTGHHGDSLRTYVVWRWYDRNSREIKRKVDHGTSVDKKTTRFTDPE
jgi:antitoxin component YwqK of YwqJK toxin-antitoxin module